MRKPQHPVFLMSGALYPVCQWKWETWLAGGEPWAVQRFTALLRGRACAPDGGQFLWRASGCGKVELTAFFQSNSGSKENKYKNSSWLVSLILCHFFVRGVNSIMEYNLLKNFLAIKYINDFKLLRFLGSLFICLQRYYLSKWPCGDLGSYRLFHLLPCTKVSNEKYPHNPAL